MFKKWIEIENVHNAKYIKKATSLHPELLNPLLHFAVSEKIDGANFSIIFSPQGEISFARRKDELKPGETFYNYQSAFLDPECNAFKNQAKAYAMRHNVTLQFVGELFGKGIQKRIYYGDGVYWKWFAIYEIDGEGNTHIYDYAEMNKIIADEIPHALFFRATILLYVMGLDAALHFDIEKDSTYTPEGYDKPNLMEGVVIRPMENFYVNNSLFIMKLKNEKFSDINVKKEKKELHVSEQLQSFYDKVAGMVNENRTADLFSKYGMIEEMKQFGMYLGYYAKDVFEDMMKYYGDEYDALADDAERKWVKKQITSLVRDELMEIFKRG